MGDLWIQHIDKKSDYPPRSLGKGIMLSPSTLSSSAEKTRTRSSSATHPPLNNSRTDGTSLHSDLQPILHHSCYHVKPHHIANMDLNPKYIRAGHEEKNVSGFLSFPSLSTVLLTASNWKRLPEVVLNIIDQQKQKEKSQLSNITFHNNKHYTPQLH